MGEGCQVRATWTNRSFIAVARDATGFPFVAGGANYESQAKQAALEECRKDSYDCKIERVFSNSPFPLRIHPKSPRRAGFNVVVWPKGTPRTVEQYGFPGIRPWLVGNAQCRIGTLQNRYRDGVHNRSLGG